MRGKFIVIEGGDGAGKDTQIALLRREFGDENFVYTREPGGTKLGTELRNMLLHESHGKVALLAEVFLFLADRAQHMSDVIVPALEAGKTVISNRSWISMIVFQIYGRDRFDLKPLVERAIAVIYRDCPFDRAIILDLPTPVSLARQRAAGKKFDVMESMSSEARQRIRQGFLDAAQDISEAIVVNADRTEEEVYADVRAAVLLALSR